MSNQDKQTRAVVVSPVLSLPILPTPNSTKYQMQQNIVCKFVTTLISLLLAI